MGVYNETVKLYHKSLHNLKYPLDTHTMQLTSQMQTCLCREWLLMTGRTQQTVLCIRLAVMDVYMMTFQSMIWPGEGSPQDSMTAPLSSPSKGSMRGSNDRMCPVLQSAVATKLRMRGNLFIWITWYEEYMQIMVLFLPCPSLLLWSVAIANVVRKLGRIASSGHFSFTAFSIGTPSLSVIRMHSRLSTFESSCLRY